MQDLTPLVVAPLELADGATLDALLALQRVAYRVEAALIGTDAIPPLQETREQLAGCVERFLGAFEGALIGAISYMRSDITVDIHRLVVDPSWFRRGVGRMLVDRLGVHEHGAERLLVATASANRPARALYESCGFRLAGEHIAPGGIRIVEYERPVSRDS